MSDPDMKAAFYGAMQKTLQDNTFTALLGDADGNLFIMDGGKPNFVWARVLKSTGATKTQVRCTALPPIYGLEVKVRNSYADGVLEVVDLNYNSSKEHQAGWPLGVVGLHAAQHGYYAGDPLRLMALQYDPLLTHPSQVPSLEVLIDPIAFQNSDGWQGFEGSSIDLTPYVPSDPDIQVLILTGLDTETGTPTVLTSDLEEPYTGAKAVPFDIGSLSAFEVTDNFLPSALIRLYSDQTRIDNYDICHDARLWLSGGAGGSGGVSTYFDGQFSGTHSSGPTDTTLTLSASGQSSNVTITGNDFEMPGGRYLLTVQANPNFDASQSGTDQLAFVFLNVTDSSIVESVAAQSLILTYTKDPMDGLYIANTWVINLPSAKTLRWNMGGNAPPDLTGNLHCVLTRL